MLTLLLGISATGLSGQTKIEPGATYTGDEPGYVFTGQEVVELRRGLAERDLLEERAMYSDSLYSICQQRREVLSTIVHEQQELIEDYADMKAPGLLTQATDRGTALVAILMAIGVAFSGQ